MKGLNSIARFLAGPRHLQPPGRCAAAETTALALFYNSAANDRISNTRAITIVRPPSPHAGSKAIFGLE